MLLTVLIFLLFYLGLDVKHAVFGVEAAMIVEFAVFWILQTREFRKEQSASAVAESRSTGSTPPATRPPAPARPSK